MGRILQTALYFRQLYEIRHGLDDAEACALFGAASIEEIADRVLRWRPPLRRYLHGTDEPTARRLLAEGFPADGVTYLSIAPYAALYGPWLVEVESVGTLTTLNDARVWEACGMQQGSCRTPLTPTTRAVWEPQILALRGQVDAIYHVWNCELIHINPGRLRVTAAAPLRDFMKVHNARS